MAMGVSPTSMRGRRRSRGVPGRLLRQEPLPDQLMLTNAAKGLRVLYTSTDGIDGKSPIAVSGAIYLPKGTPPAGGWPIVAWAHGTTGTADVCAPSWMERGTRDTDYLNAWLAAGLCGRRVRLSGPGHPWRTSLDGGAAGGLERARQRAVSAPAHFRNWRTRSSSSGSRRGRMPRCPPRGWPRVRPDPEDQGDGRDRSGRRPAVRGVATNHARSCFCSSTSSRRWTPRSGRRTT